MPVLRSMRKVRFGKAMKSGCDVVVGEDGHINRIVHVRHAGAGRVKGQQSERECRRQRRFDAEKLIQNRLPVVGSTDDKIG